MQGSQKKEFGEDEIVFGVSVSGILDAIFGPMFMKYEFKLLLISTLLVRLSFFSLISLVIDALGLLFLSKIWFINRHCFEGSFLFNCIM